MVGEIRGAEVVDLLAALNTGHDGGAGTLHANSLHEVPARMEALAALGGLDRTGLHSQLAAAVDVVLTKARKPEGRRLREIGILTGNPVTTEVIWSTDAYPHPGYQSFRDSLALRTHVPRTHAPSDFEPRAVEEDAKPDAVTGNSNLHIPVGFDGSLDNFRTGEIS